MKSERPAYREGLEVMRFDNRVRCDYGFHFNSYNPLSGTLTVIAREEELKCDRTQVPSRVEAALGSKASIVFPGIMRTVVIFYPLPITIESDFRYCVAAFHSRQEEQS